MKRKNYLEDGLVDIGVAANLKLQESKVKAEAKRKFRGKCKRFIINVFIKISERSPMQFSNVRNSISLDPISMVRHQEESSQRFTKLADRLFTLKKIAANIADKAKSQYDDLLKVACFNQKDKFLDFKVKSDRLEVFLVGLLPEKFYSELLKVSKIIFIISHGQNFTERGFSINKEVNDCNMQEKSLTCQRVVYYALQDKKIYEIEIDQQLRKSCQLSYQKYEAELELLGNEDKKTERDIKRKLKLDEIETVKKKKLNIQSSIDALKEGIFTETLAADENQDLTLTAKAASFCRTMKEKQKTLKDF